MSETQQVEGLPAQVALQPVLDSGKLLVVSLHPPAPVGFPSDTTASGILQRLSIRILPYDKIAYGCLPVGDPI